MGFLKFLNKRDIKDNKELLDLPPLPPPTDVGDDLGLDTIQDNIPSAINLGDAPESSQDVPKIEDFNLTENYQPELNEIPSQTILNDTRKKTEGKIFSFLKRAEKKTIPNIPLPIEENFEDKEKLEDIQLEELGIDTPKPTSYITNKSKEDKAEKKIRTLPVIAERVQKSSVSIPILKQIPHTQTATYKNYISVERYSDILNGLSESKSSALSAQEQITQTHNKEDSEFKKTSHKLKNELEEIHKNLTIIDKLLSTT